MLVYLHWRVVSPFYSIRKKDGAQIYNEIKARAKGDILIVSQKNLIFHIILHYITLHHMSTGSYHWPGTCYYGPDYE